MIQYVCTTKSHNRFRTSEVTGTLLGCDVVVDIEGRRIDKDPNYYCTRYVCITCNKVYTRIQHGWTVKFFAGDVSHLNFDNMTCFHEEDITPAHMRGIRQ